jgi:catechol 2,3-dioxygenase-like lactoylglutathione lyase family enzyme
LADGVAVERVDFVVVPTRDRDRALRFYGETLGLRANPHAAPSFPEFETGNVTIAIASPEEMGMPFAPLPPGQIALRVADVASARAELESTGVEFHGETFDSGVCHMAFFADPDGNGLMLHRRYAPAGGAGA